MSESRLSTIDVGKYLALLRDVLPEVEGIAAFDANGRLLVSVGMWPNEAAFDFSQYLEAHQVQCESGRKALWLLPIAPSRIAVRVDITTVSPRGGSDQASSFFFFLGISEGSSALTIFSRRSSTLPASLSSE